MFNSKSIGKTSRRFPQHSACNLIHIYYFLWCIKAVNLSENSFELLLYRVRFLYSNLVMQLLKIFLTGHFGIKTFFYGFSNEFATEYPRIWCNHIISGTRVFISSFCCTVCVRFLTTLNIKHIWPSVNAVLATKLLPKRCSVPALTIDAWFLK